MDKGAALSSTVRAGRLLRLLGWITLALILPLGAAILIPILAKGIHFRGMSVSPSLVQSQSSPCISSLVRA